MNDMRSWSIPLGRISNISIRAHLLLVLFSIAYILRALKPEAGPSYALDMLQVQVILWVSILLHELGHCYAARHVGGDADEVLLWPLGGLAMTQVPNQPRAHFITTLGGPLVNFLLCLGAWAGLSVFGLLPPFYIPWLNDWLPFDFTQVGKEFKLHTSGLYSWYHGASTAGMDLSWLQMFLARLFFINWALFWFNVLLVGFPLDGGRLLQAYLWARIGFHRATRIACYSGYTVAILLGLGVFLLMNKENYANGFLLAGLALFIYLSCRQQLMMLEMEGWGEESLYGDFSQGYTSYERGQSQQTKPKKPSFWQRWKQERAEKKRQKEEAERIAEEARVDELLAKMHAGGGLQALTAEEQRFLKKVSAKFREKRQG
jgi:stage IV sporulation protein FB